MPILDNLGNKNIKIFNPRNVWNFAGNQSTRQVLLKRINKKNNHTNPRFDKNKSITNNQWPLYLQNIYK